MYSNRRWNGWLLLAVALVAGCVSGVRYTQPSHGALAEITVTSNRGVTNQWVRLHPEGCNFEASQIVGALNNRTAGWPSTGPELRFEVSAGREVTIGVMGLVAAHWLGEDGRVIGTKYSECYPTATFTVREGHKYWVEQSSEISNDVALCGYSIFESPSGAKDRRPVMFKLDQCKKSS